MLRKLGLCSLLICGCCLMTTGSLTAQSLQPLKPVENQAPQPAKHYIVTMRFVSMPMGAEGTIPAPLQNVLDELSTDQVKVMGGAPVDDKQALDSAVLPTSTASSTPLNVETPSLKLLLNSEQAKMLVQGAASDQRSNVMTAPKIVIRSGETGSVMDTVSRVLVGQVETNKTQTYLGQTTPIYKGKPSRFDEGTQVQVKVTKSSEDQVRLESTVLFSRLESVQEVKIGSKRNPESAPTIQFPRMKISSFQTDEELKLKDSVVMVYPGMLVETRIEAPGFMGLFGKSKIQKQDSMLCLLMSIEEQEIN